MVFTIYLFSKSTNVLLAEANLYFHEKKNCVPPISKFVLLVEAHIFLRNTGRGSKFVLTGEANM